MTQKPEKKRDAMASEHAVNVVLEAEVDARREVENSAAEADAILQQARESARRVLQRADRRIARVRHHAGQRLAEAISELESSGTATPGDTGLQGTDRETLAVAVDQLATLLTTVTGEEGDARPRILRDTRVV